MRTLTIGFSMCSKPLGLGGGQRLTPSAGPDRLWAGELCVLFGQIIQVFSIFVNFPEFCGKILTKERGNVGFGSKNCYR
jgi:hypothetical protein